MLSKQNAVLLAGGESSRYGENKALTSFAGRTLIEYIYSKLTNYFKRVIIIGSRDDYNFIKGAEIREDLFENRGPLAGLYTGLYYSDAEYNFVCGCDMPFLDEDYFSFLESFIASEKSDSNYQLIVSEYRSYLEPLAAFYHKNLLAEIKKNIEEDNLRIKSFYDQSKLKIIREEELKLNFDLEKLFFNINYPEDKKRAIKILEGADTVG